MKKTTLLSLAAATAMLLSGCAAPKTTKPPGHYVEPNREEDFALTCDDIWMQSESTKSELTRYRDLLQSYGDSVDRRETIRDNAARLRVLHRWGQKKGCDEQWGLGSFSPDQVAPATQQPAAKEKARVIICNDDQTCIVE